MRTRSLIILALLTFAVLVGIWWLGEKSPGTFAREITARQAWQFSADAVNALELTTEQGTFAFRKGEKNWCLQTPVKYPANNSAVSGLLSQLAFLDRRAALNKTQLGDLAPYGLKTPLTVVKFKTVSGAEFELDLGKPTAVAGGVYARIVSGGRESYAVVEQGVARQLQRTLDQWRSRRVFDFAVDDVTGVVLREEAREVEIKREDGAWQITKPLTARANEDEMSVYLACLQSLQITEFVTDNPADHAAYNLTSPLLTLDVSLGKETVTLRVGKVEAGEETKYYAQQTAYPAVFPLPPLTVDYIARLLDTVRDRRLIRVADGERVTAIEYRKGAVTVSLQADSDNNWQLVSPIQGAADSDAMRLLLAKLTNARAENSRLATEENRAAANLKNPAAQITLTLSGTAETQPAKTCTLTFTAPKKAEMTVESTFRNDLATIPADVLIGLPAKPAEWLAPSR